MELTKNFDIDTEEYSLILSDDYKKLKISYSNNGDLYMTMTEGRKLDNKYGDSMFMDIKQEDGSIYDAFYNLNNRIIEKNKKHPTKLVDIENNIVWLDENRSEDEADKFMIMDYGEIIRLKFIRVSDYKHIFRHKNSRNINIRFCMDGTRYTGYSKEFAKLYKDILETEGAKVYRK